MRDKKSLFVNLVSIFLIVLGYMFPNYGEVVKVIGFFAFSGAITNWLAIYMLFERVPLLYGSGIIPLQFEVFKKSIKKIIVEQFFNEENLKKFLNANAILGDKEILVKKVLNSFDYEKIYESLLEEILNTSLGKMLNMFGGVKALGSLKDPCIHKLKNIGQEVIEQSIAHFLVDVELTETIKGKIDEMLNTRLQELTPNQVKKLVKEMIEKYLGWIVVWGGIFGGFIGFCMEVIFKI